MLATTAVAFFSLLAILGIFWLKRRWKRMNYFKELNIPGPAPHLIFGNMKELLELGPHKAHVKWTKEYGKTFGYFFGGLPIIVVGDPDLLRRIQIKDFQKFTNRPVFVVGGPNVGSVFNRHIVAKKDYVWRHQRSVISPSFTTTSLKQMFPSLEEATGEFLTVVRKWSDLGQEFDIEELYGALALDSICRAIFGVRSGVQANPTDPLLVSSGGVFPRDFFSGLRFITMCLPEFEVVLHPVRLAVQWTKDLLGLSRMRFLRDWCKATAVARKSRPQNRGQDLLQRMLDHLASETEKKRSQVTNSDGTEWEGRRAMDDVEVFANMFLIFIAGQGTTSSLLSFSTHVLANDLDLQEKVRDELRAVLAQDLGGSFDCESILRCQYLDQFLKETLRFHPVGVLVNSRQASVDVKYDNLFLPKGCVVQVSLNLNRDPDIWKHPDTFDPERWSPENGGHLHPLAFQPFGAGPRMCVGKRLATLQVKLVLANLLLNFRLLPGDSTLKGELPVLLRMFIMTPKNGVYVKVQKI